MRILKYTFFLLFVCTQALSRTDLRRLRDHRSYHSITLGSPVWKCCWYYMISASKSAVAVALPIGSLEDPKSQPGLAHYLEHMLFLGSKEYPGAERSIRPSSPRMVEKPMRPQVTPRPRTCWNWILRMQEIMLISKRHKCYTF